MSDRGNEARVAENDATFRDANERIAHVAAEGELTLVPIPFLCECADPDCREVVRLRLADYQHVRSSPRWFATAPGHEDRAGEDGNVVEEHDGYSIIGKQGLAGEIVEAIAETEGLA